MVRAVIFDCFGVLCVDAHTAMMQQCHPDRRQQLSDIFAQGTHGFLSPDECNERAAELLERESAAVGTMVQRGYVLDTAMVAFVRLLHRSYTTALLSNTSEQVMDILLPTKQRGEMFDGVFVSSSIGVIKPSQRVFEYTATQLGVLPEECVMIDDSARNIAGALQAGMDGIVFTGYNQCIRELAERGVHA